MALIRQVAQNRDSLLWAYIETSDEDEKLFCILGNMEFLEEQEAITYSEGFEDGSYEYAEPKAKRILALQAGITLLEGQLEDLKAQLLILTTPTTLKK